MVIECPVCGSANLEKNVSNEILQGDFGEAAYYKKTSYKCLDCESEGDFFKENADAINFALDILKKKYVKSTLDYFIDNKISFSAIERILDLPQRTLTKWKNDVSQPTAAGIALLKFLRMFPWLLDVAEHSYDYDAAQKIFLRSAFDILLQKISFSKNDTREIGVFITNKSNLPYIYTEKNGEILFDNKNLADGNHFRMETNRGIPGEINALIPNNQGQNNEIELFSYL
jgi:transposase-like protein